MNVRLVTPPAVEPITLAQANFHLRLSVDAEDDSPKEEDSLVTSLIVAARQAAEAYLNRPIALATYEIRSDCFRRCLPISPIQEVLSVKYDDTQGGTTTLAPEVYEIAGSVDEPVLRAAWGQEWPSGLRRQDDAVKMRVLAGYGGDFPLPMPIYQAMLLTIGHLYENREDSTSAQLRELPMGSRSLLNPYRIGMGI